MHYFNQYQFMGKVKWIKEEWTTKTNKKMYSIKIEIRKPEKGKQPMLIKLIMFDDVMKSLKAQKITPGIFVYGKGKMTQMKLKNGQFLNPMIMTEINKVDIGRIKLAPGVDIDVDASDTILIKETKYDFGKPVELRDE